LIFDALLACGLLALNDPTTAQSYFTEAAELARTSGDRLRLCEICVNLAMVGGVWADPAGGRAAAEEGRELADAVGDQFMSWNSQVWLGIALSIEGILGEAARVLSSLAGTTTGNFQTVLAHVGLGRVRASQGDAAAARASAEAALDAGAAM